MFISYARSTKVAAQTLAEALRGLGYEVWLDDQLPAHRAFSDVLEERLLAAKAVVVVWSPDAARSEWVRSEANRAREANKLVQLKVMKTTLPMPFDQFECADMIGWSGDLAAQGWRKVIASVSELVGEAVQSGGVKPGPEPVEPLLAVLAFDNLSGDEGMVYFSDGVSEEIQQTVARSTGIKVIGRGSSFQFRGADKAAAHVRASLNASHVLDGSVRRSGPKVRISTQLIDCASQTTLWSERFDRDLSDIFALQEEIAEAVANALKIRFAPAVQTAAIDPAAYELYLKALETYRKPGADASLRAPMIGLLERATDLAPTFARAWAYLALARAVHLRIDEPKQPYDVGRAEIAAAAQTALQLDPGSGLAYQALSLLEPFAHYAEREALQRKALSIGVQDVDALGNAGRFSFEVGRIHEALGFLKQAREFDPMSPGAAYGYAFMVDAEGRYEESRGLWERFCALWPDNDRIRRDAILAAALNSDWPRFDDLVKAARDRSLYTPSIRATVWYGRNLRDPNPASVDLYMEQIREILSRTGSVPLEQLYIGYRLGRTDMIFDMIDQASFTYLFDPKQRWLGGNTSPGVIFSVIHNNEMMRDTRFPNLCAKLGLCSYWTKTGQWPDCANEGALPYDFKAECRRLDAV